MASVDSIEEDNRTPQAKRPGVHRKGNFAGGTITPQQALEARWGKDRRTVVAMAQEARPEAFAVIVTIMRDERVEPPTRLRAGELILAYSDGKPRQSVDVSIGGPREMNTLARVELEAIARGAPPPFQLAHNGNVIEGEVLSSGAAGEEPVARTANKRRDAAGKQA